MPAPSSNLPHASSAGALALTVVIWGVWLGVMFVADLLAFMMFAFADSPGSARAARAMIAPVFAWFAFTLVAGAFLLYQRRPWQIVLAFVLAVSPPFVVFAGYNLLSGGGGGSVVPSAGHPATAPAVNARVPPGGFRPPPMTVPRQPDFRGAFPTGATTQPATTTTAPAAATTRP